MFIDLKNQIECKLKMTHTPLDNFEGNKEI